MKPHFITTPPNSPLSQFAQEQLFKRGCQWLYSGREIKAARTVINVERCGDMTTDNEPVEPRFNLATQVGEWLAFLDEPEKPTYPKAFECRGIKWGHIRKDGGFELEKPIYSMDAEFVDTIHAASQAARTEGRE